MDADLTRTAGSLRLKRDLGQEAVNLALNGEWERATEVNRAILELFADDVEAMNRLAKALMELGSYDEAQSVLDRVCEIAPYNKIAKKNRARLEQLGNSPAVGKQAGKPVRKAAGAPQMFIEESGKSGTTVLRNTAKSRAIATVASSDAVALVEANDGVTVQTVDGEYLGQIEPKLGKRLSRLIQGGNEYAAAVVGVNEQGVSIIIRETFRHRNLRNVCSFPTKSDGRGVSRLNENVVRFMQDGELDDDDDDDENVIDEEAMENDWAENE